MIKTENLQKGYSGLVLELRRSGEIVKKLMTGDTGTVDWKRIQIDCKVDSCDEVYFGAFIDGTGTSWFDKLELFIDDKKVEDFAPRKKDLSRNELFWLKKHTYPVRLSDSINYNYKLSFLKSIIGRASVVSLGENTHGSHEVNIVKNMIVRDLMQNHGFNTLSLEANIPESDDLSNYIQSGKGNPVDLIKSLILWPWTTIEFLENIKFLREFNKSKNGISKIKFAGFDMQLHWKSIEILEKEFDSDSIYQRSVKLVKDILSNVDLQKVETPDLITDENKNIVLKELAKLKKSIQVNHYSNVKSNCMGT